MSAEDVVADEDAHPGEVLDTVGRLVEQSMVVVEPGPTSRYRMLETLRQYAAEQLQASGQAVEVARRHAAYFRSIVEHAEVALRGHEQRQTLRLLREEQPNIRAALAFLSGPDGDRDAALMMAGSLGMFWHLGRHLEGRHVLSRLVAGHEGSPAARALALQAVSIVERPRGCLVHPSPRCAETAAESLALFEELGDAWHAALSRVLLAVEGVTGAEPERSQALLAAAEEQFHRDGDPWGPAVIGFVRTGDRDQDRRRRHRGPHRPHHRRCVPAARRLLGTVRHPVPPRMGVAAVRPLRRRSPRPGGGYRRRAERRIVEHRPVGTGRPGDRQGARG